MGKYSNYWEHARAANDGSDEATAMLLRAAVTSNDRNYTPEQLANMRQALTERNK